MDPEWLSYRLKDRILPDPDTGVAEGKTPRFFHEGGVVGSFIPKNFAACARVLHPAHRRDGGVVTWAEAASWAGRQIHPEMTWEAVSRPSGLRSGSPPWDEEPSMGNCPLPILAALAERLGAFTSTPDRCHIMVWRGWGGLDADVPEAGVVSVPGRQYLLFKAPLSAIGGGLFHEPFHRTGPAIWWPDDGRWYVSTEVDHRGTYVAGSRECVNAVLADDNLEAFEARLDHVAS